MISPQHLIGWVFFWLFWFFFFEKTCSFLYFKVKCGIWDQNLPVINALRHQRLVHLPNLDTNSHPNCDQRLTASKVSTHFNPTLLLWVTTVINALRHERLVHISLMTWRTSLISDQRLTASKVSTQVETFGANTTELVINALRHQRLVHKQRSTGPPVNDTVINALRHQRLVHWIKAAFRKSF